MSGSRGSPAQADIDRQYMRQALELAYQAARIGEVPVGALIVKGDEVLAQAHNLRESGTDPTAHAEVLAIRHAAAELGAWRLADCALYVTIEPCPMCAGAAVLARIARIIYGAPDPKAGACGTLMNLAQDPRLNHRIEVTAGVLASECAQVMRGFFDQRR